MIKLYIPDGESVPFQSYIEEGMVSVITQEPDFYTTIERKNCACNTINDIAVYNNSIFIKSKDQYIVGSSCYRVKFETKDEFEICVLWLIKSHFQTFSSNIGKFFCNRTEKWETTLERKVTTFFFNCRPLPCQCFQYTLDEIPVYCLKHIVVSGENKGPTIGSVIKINGNVTGL